MLNLSELILNKNQIIPFIITVLLSVILYKFLNKTMGFTSEISIPLPVLICMIYIIFLIIFRIVTTNTNFSIPLVNYIIQKKNFKEEPYQINYVNPFVTNLDKVDFNMKRGTNKKYIKRILNELLIRKYVQFENVLGYNKDPWKITVLEVKVGEDEKYTTENDGDILIKDNKYCKNYLAHLFGLQKTTGKNNKEISEKQCLILFRKHILQFAEKLYFIFEKKNKKDSKYYLNECISQIVINSTSDYYSIIDTRDLHYDRQYVVFIDFPTSGDRTKKQWQRPDNTFKDGYYDPNPNATSTIKDYKPNTEEFQRVYKKFLETPIEYYWQNDYPLNIVPTTADYAINKVDKWKNIYVIDIYFVYNDMVILDENRNISNSMDKGAAAENTADFSLNKYYDKKDWIMKRYYDFVRNQFNNRMPETNLNMYINDTINDISTIKFRTILGKNVFKIKNINMKIYINKQKLGNNYTNEIILYEGGNKEHEIKINFEEYIKTYIQNKDIEPNELVTIKDSKTKYDEKNSLIVDKSTINYVSFNFLNIKKAETMKKGDGKKEYRKKMNYIANEILKKYFEPQLKSINKIKYNMETLGIIQMDSLYRYNGGRKRLVLNGKIITPNNIGATFNDISLLRESYKKFLESELNYKINLNTLIETGKNDLNVSNIKLLEILNTNSFNKKSKFLGIIDKISHSEEEDNEFAHYATINTDATVDSKLKESVVYDLKKKLTKLHILQAPNGYRKPSHIPLFVKFNTIINVNGFNINPNNVYIIHKTQNNQTLKPQAIYLEEFLLEPDTSNSTVKVIPPSGPSKLPKPIKLYDCTNSFRKETIGVANVIKIVDKKTFVISFDNIPLEFKDLIGDDSDKTNNIYIDKPIFIMLNISKIDKINQISKNIYENQLYKVFSVKSTTLNDSAQITVHSNYDLDLDSRNMGLNFIYKDILVSQYITSGNYIENVYFKRIEGISSEGTSPPISYEIVLKNQVININPPIRRIDIIENYKEKMSEIIDYIYTNEATKIHYEIPEDIGIYKDTSAAVYSYKYKNELYVSYDKRNNPINYFKNTNSNYLCMKRYRGDTYFLNIKALYNLDSVEKYYKYFKNMFKNIIGLHDEINYECDEYFKSGRMIDRLKLPISFNKYVSFSNNFMLYFKDEQLLDDIDSKFIGKHIVIQNNVLDNNLLNTFNSNRNNSNIYKRFIKDIIYEHDIGTQGFEYEDAKKICERIYTVYDKKCNDTWPTYKIQSDEYNIDFYKNNKNRDQCFNIVYNTEKELDNQQFIAKIKGFDPTAEANDIENNSIHDFHVDSIPEHKYYNLSGEVGVSATLAINGVDSDYEKYIWLKNMIEKKGKIIVSNTAKYFKIEQLKKDSKIVNIVNIQTSSTSSSLNTTRIPRSSTVTDAIKASIAFAAAAAEGGAAAKAVAAGAAAAIASVVAGDDPADAAADAGAAAGAAAAAAFTGTDANAKTDAKTAATNAASTATVDAIAAVIKTNHFKFALDYEGYRFSGEPDVTKTTGVNIADDIAIEREKKENWLQEKIDKFSDIIIHKTTNYKYHIYKISIPKDQTGKYTFKIKLTPIIKIETWGNQDKLTSWTYGNYRFYKGTYDLKVIEEGLRENKWKTDNAEAMAKYENKIKLLEKIGNIQVKPHRLAQLNEIRTAAYYNAEWDNIAWINDANPHLYNKSNLIRVKDKKVLWFDKDDPNAKDKGVVCYGRKLDQNKLGQNKQNELFNFQMERIEQNIKDLEKYENVSKFNKEVYSRWNL